MKNKKTPKKIARSSKTGRIVSKKFAKENPDTTQVETETTLAKAVKVLQKNLKTDKGFYYGYQSNIAMAFVDEAVKYCKDNGIKNLSKDNLYRIANGAAKNFLNLLIKQ